jgi:hypothetical protein
MMALQCKHQYTWYRSGPFAAARSGPLERVVSPAYVLSGMMSQSTWTTK